MGNRQDFVESFLAEDISGELSGLRERKEKRRIERLGTGTASEKIITDSSLSEKEREALIKQ